MHWEYVKNLGENRLRNERLCCLHGALVAKDQENLHNIAALLSVASVQGIGAGNSNIELNESVKRQNIGDLVSQYQDSAYHCPLGACLELNFSFPEEKQADELNPISSLALALKDVYRRLTSSSKESYVEIVLFVEYNCQIEFALESFVDLARKKLSTRVAESGELHTKDCTFFLPEVFTESSKAITVTWSSGDFYSPFNNSNWEKQPEFARQRASLLEQLKISERVPLFLSHRCLASVIKHETQGVLRSPHKEILRKRKCEETTRETSAIFGDFDYYHYESNDIGWGCAYRSLQMLISWLKLNGYIDLPKVPSVETIQEKLIGINVMDSRFFVGCKRFIGSQEIGWILSSISNGLVEPRFVFVKGKHISGLLYDLSDHFKTNYSPVVVCGGNIALVILAVTFSATLEDMERPLVPTEFLIADPHYSGADKYSDIVGRSFSLGGFTTYGVAWRTIEQSFRSDTDYTLVLPSVSNF